MLIDDEADQQFSLVQEVITRIRDARNQMNVEPSRRIPVSLAVGEDLAMFTQQTPLIGSWPVLRSHNCTQNCR